VWCVSVVQLRAYEASTTIISSVIKVPISSRKKKMPSREIDARIEGAAVLEIFRLCLEFCREECGYILYIKIAFLIARVEIRRVFLAGFLAFTRAMQKVNGCRTERQAVAPFVVVVAVVIIVSLPFPSVLFAPRNNICLIPRRAPPRYAATDRT